MEPLITQVAAELKAFYSTLPLEPFEISILQQIVEFKEKQNAQT